MKNKLEFMHTFVYKKIVTLHYKNKGGNKN